MEKEKIKVGSSGTAKYSSNLKKILKGNNLPEDSCVITGFVSIGWYDNNAVALVSYAPIDKSRPTSPFCRLYFLENSRLVGNPLGYDPEIYGADLDTLQRVFRSDRLFREGKSGFVQTQDLLHDLAQVVYDDFKMEDDPAVEIFSQLLEEGDYKVSWAYSEIGNKALCNAVMNFRRAVSN